MNKRNYSIDAIKALACFFVPAVHFRNRIQLKIPKEIFGSNAQIVMGLDYAIFVIGVPLFLMCTGYLMSNKKMSKNYVLSIIKVYLLYWLIAILTYFFMIHFSLWEPMGTQALIKSISEFKLISGWYVEMYLGLALLIPFINKMTSSLNKKEYESLFIVLIILIGLPALVNSNPTMSSYFMLPKFWVELYPVMYYLAGSYIKKYVSRESLTIKYLIITALVYILSTLSIFYLVVKYADPYTHTTEGYYSSILVLISAVTFFLLIYGTYNINSKFVKLVSTHTLPAYLMAYPVDVVIYPKMIELIGSANGLIKYMPVMAVMSFLISLFIGVIINYLFNVIWRTCELLTSYIINMFNKSK